MFIEKLREEYPISKPIFTKEILELFSNYSKMQVFRYIKLALQNGDLIQYNRGVYYLSSINKDEFSIINPDIVVIKKYLFDGDNKYGIFSGFTLQNIFSVSDQFPFIQEIVTNNESSNKRTIKIHGRKFILRKSHTKITNENIATYTILQLFNDLESDAIINDYAKEKVISYIKENNVTTDKLLKLSIYFDSKVVKKMINNKIIYAAS